VVTKHDSHVITRVPTKIITILVFGNGIVLHYINLSILYYSSLSGNGIAGLGFLLK
jgi:hypothetical protein